MLTVVKCLNYYRVLLFSSCSSCLCRQLPHSPENLIATLSSSERRTINLTWAQAFDGNSPLIRYILEVSENSEFSGLRYFSATLLSVCSPFWMSVFVTDAPWTVLLANIDPEASSAIVGGLIPARSYQFRLCAVNDVGKGQFSRETVRWVWDSKSKKHWIIFSILTAKPEA